VPVQHPKTQRGQLQPQSPLLDALCVPFPGVGKQVMTQLRLQPINKWDGITGSNAKV
jgi:hypothetical protein